MHTTIPRCLRPQCTSICAAKALDGLEAFPSDQHRMVAVDNGVSLLCLSSARQKRKNAQLKDERTNLDVRRSMLSSLRGEGGIFRSHAAVTVRTFLYFLQSVFNMPNNFLNRFQQRKNSTQSRCMWDPDFLTIGQLFRKLQR